MANRLVAYLSIALVATLAVACGASATSHFYTLSSTAASDGAPAASYAIAVGPVTIPGYADRPQFVVQAGPNRVELKEFERWATPLDEAVARVVAGDLATLLGATEVATVPLPTGFAPAYQVAIDVQRFESTPGQGVLLEAVWVARRAVGGEPRMGRTVANESAAGEGFETLAAAHSRALAKVSVDIAAAIQTLAATKP
jgi:uncharacterized lipoprotein YmbA